MVNWSFLRGRNPLTTFLTMTRYLKPPSAPTVGKALVTVLTWSGTAVSTQEKNLTNAPIVTRATARTPTWSSTCDLTQVRNRTAALIVAKASLRAPTSSSTSGHTQENVLSPVLNVDGVSATALISSSTSESTRVRSPMSAPSVGNAFHRVPKSPNTSAFTLANDHFPAGNVPRHFVFVPT